MTYLLRICLPLLTALLFSINCFSQQTQLGCNDRALRLQAEQFKADFKPQGFTTYKDAMLTMESEYPSSIMVQLTKGIMYQMVFIGPKKASKISLELLDGEDHKIDSKTLKGLGETNYILYSFVPEKSDIYLVVLNQKFKGETMCGSFTILEKKETDTK